MTVPKLDLDKMNDETLVELARIYLKFDKEKQEETLASLLELATMIEGKKGRGKTLSAVGISWWLRELFERPVVTIGSKMGLKPEFGAFQNMSEMAFRDELERITLVASEEENAEKVAKAFEKYGISILYATLVFDEAYKLFDARRSSDKLIQLFGYFVAQSRHYHCTIILCSPMREMIDKRVRHQLDWQGRVYHNKYTHTARVRLVSGIDVLTIEVHGLTDPTPELPFYGMYDSWSLLGFRKASLDIHA